MSTPRRNNAARLFGYDVFLSFALGPPPRGTHSYASDLARRLRERDFTIFFSEDEASPGEQLNSTLLTALQRSRVLVVIANRGTLEEPRWVRQEVGEFRRRHPDRPVIPISIGGAVQDPRLAEQTRWLECRDKIWLDESDDAVTKGIASDNVVARLALAPAGRRSNVKWRWVVRTVVAALLVLAVAATGFGIYARNESRIAVTKAREAQENAERAEKQRQEAVTARKLADDNAKKAQDSATEANRQRNVAFSRELAVTSNSQLQVDPELSVLLALEAVKASGTDQAEDALRRALLESHVRTRLQHRRAVETAEFDAKGGRVLTASGDKAFLWETQRARTPIELRGHNGRVSVAIFSPDGARVLTGSADHTARIWDTSSGKVLAVLSGHTSEVVSAAFTRDGKAAVTVGLNDGARIWDVSSGSKLAQLQTTTDAVSQTAWTADGRRVIPEVLGSNVLRAAVSTDDKWIVTGGREGTVYVWDRASGNLMATLKGHTTHIGSVAFSPDGKRVLTASYDRTARIWDATTGSQLRVLKGHSATVIKAVFSDDGSRIATASWDGTARIWDGKSGTLRAELRGHTSTLNSVAFSTNGKYLVTTSSDNTARVWDADSGVNIAVLRGHTAQVNSASFSPDDAMIVTTSDDRTVRLWALDVLELKGAESSLLAATFSPDGRLVATGSLDGASRIWDSRSGREIATLSGHSGPVSIVAFNRQGKLLVSGSFDMTARVWDADTGAHLATLDTNSGPLNFATFSSDGKLVATPGDVNKVWVWDANTGKRVAELPANDNTYYTVFSSDGRYVVTTGQNGKAHLWETSGWQQITEFSKVRYAAFSPDGKYLGLVGEAGTKPVCYILKGKGAPQLDGCPEKTLERWIWPRLFNSDGSLKLRLDHGAVRIQETQTKQSFMELPGNSGAINSAAFSPRGKRFVTACDDGTARIYECDTCVSFKRLLSLASKRVTRDLTAEEKAKYLHEGDTE